MSYQCLNCHSENTQQLPLAWELGKTQNKATSVGAVFGSGPGFGAALTRGSSQSVLSKRLAPPEVKSTKAALATSGFLLMVGVAILLVALAFSTDDNVARTITILLAGIICIPAIKLVTGAGKMVGVKKRELRDLWASLCICNRCGNIFEPAASNQTEENLDPSAYSAVLLSIGESRLSAVAEMHSVLGLRLRDASNAVKKVPCTVLSNVSKNEAMNVVTRLGSVGSLERFPADLNLFEHRGIP